MEAVIQLDMSEQKRFSITDTVQEFGKKLFGFIRGRVQSNEDAEDILQEVWYQFSNLTAIDELENVSAWLYRVARNKVTDKYRKKTTDSLENYSYENDDESIGFKDLLLQDDSNNPELEQFKEQFWNELFLALDELPDNQREVFVLNELEDMTLQAIADQTGESIKTIISRKRYATNFLRKRLNDLYNDLND